MLKSFRTASWRFVQSVLKYHIGEVIAVLCWLLFTVILEALILWATAPVFSVFRMFMICLTHARIEIPVHVFGCYLCASCSSHFTLFITTDFHFFTSFLSFCFFYISHSDWSLMNPLLVLFALLKSPHHLDAPPSSYSLNQKDRALNQCGEGEGFWQLILFIIFFFVTLQLNLW